MLKRVAILQSNYIPWKGYFDIIHDVDEFIFLDDVQYTRQDWRNRNRIKTSRGPAWLTIPVGTNLKRRIYEVELPSNSWAIGHWRLIENSYARSPHFDLWRPLIEEIYLHRSWRYLSDLNQHLVRAIAGRLGVATRFHDSREFGSRESKQDRVIDIVRQIGGNVYVSGPAAMTYLDSKRFVDAGIDLVLKSYDGYPEYPQLYPPFVHEVTILDLLFNTGPDAPHYIWGWRTETP